MLRTITLSVIAAVILFSMMIVNSPGKHALADTLYSVVLYPDGPGDIQQISGQVPDEGYHYDKVIDDNDDTYVWHSTYDLGE